MVGYIEKPTGRESDKFMLRLPDGMRDRLKVLSEENRRSMNAEIVSALTEWLDRADAMKSWSSRDYEDAVAEESEDPPVSFIHTPADVEAVVERHTKDSARRLRAELMRMLDQNN